jgi:hypothetical protein
MTAGKYGHVLRLDALRIAECLGPFNVGDPRRLAGRTPPEAVLIKNASARCHDHQTVRVHCGLQHLIESGRRTLPFLSFSEYMCINRRMIYGYARVVVSANCNFHPIVHSSFNEFWHSKQTATPHPEMLRAKLL